MKHQISLFTLVLLLVAGLAACAAPVVPPTVTPVPPTVTPAPPTATPAPTATVAPGPWQVVAQSKYDFPVFYAGFANAQQGITVGYAGEVRYTTDGGKTWPKAENHSWCRFGLDIVNEKTAWHCGNGGHVRHSIDGGQTWTPVTDFGNNEPNHCRFLSFLDDKTGWAAAPAKLGLTTDGGQTWQELVLPEAETSIVAVSLVSAQAGYLLDTNGVLYFTADSGKTWVKRGLALEEKVKVESAPNMALRFTDAQTGLLVYLKGTLDTGQTFWTARTTDGGQTWQREQLPLQKQSLYNLYLSHDLKTITLIDGLATKITVFSYTPTAALN